MGLEGEGRPQELWQWDEGGPPQHWQRQDLVAMPPPPLHWHASAVLSLMFTHFFSIFSLSHTLQSGRVDDVFTIDLSTYKWSPR